MFGSNVLLFGIEINYQPKHVIQESVYSIKWCDMENLYNVIVSLNKTRKPYIGIEYLYTFKRRQKRQQDL